MVFVSFSLQYAYLLVGGIDLSKNVDKQMNKKLYNLLKFSILAVKKTVKILFSIMYNFAAKFAKILETCKKFSTNLVNDFGNVPRRGVVPKFSDLEVIALSMTYCRNRLQR